MANVYVSNFGGIKTSGFALGLTFDDEVDATDVETAISVSGDTTDIMHTLSPSAGSGEFESFHVIFTLPDNRSGAFSFELTGYTIQGGNTTFNLNVEEADSTDLVPGASTLPVNTAPTADPTTDNAYRFNTADETWYSWTDDGADGGMWDLLDSVNGAQTIAADNRIWLGIGGRAGSEDINTEAAARTYIEDPSNTIDTAKIYLFFDVDRLKKISIITSIEIQFDTEESIDACFKLTGKDDPTLLKEFPDPDAENDGYYLVDGRNVITVPICFYGDESHMTAATGIRHFSETDFVIQSLSGDDISEAETYVFATNEEHKFLLKIVLPDNKKGRFQITFDGNIIREGLENQETIFVDEPLILDFDSTVPYVEDFYMPNYRPGEFLYIRLKFNVPVRGLDTDNVVVVFNIDGVPIGTPILYKWIKSATNPYEPVDSQGVWESEIDNIDTEPVVAGDLATHSQVSTVDTVPDDSSDPGTATAYRFNTADETWYSWNNTDSQWEALSAEESANAALATGNIWLGNGGITDSDDVNTNFEVINYIKEHQNGMIPTDTTYLFYDGISLKKVSSFTLGIESKLNGLLDSDSTVPADIDLENYWQQELEGRGRYEAQGQIFLIAIYMPDDSQGKLSVSLRGGQDGVIGPFK